MKGKERITVGIALMCVFIMGMATTYGLFVYEHTTNEAEEQPELIITPTNEGMGKIIYANCSTEIVNLNVMGMELEGGWRYRLQYFVNDSQLVKERIENRSVERIVIMTTFDDGTVIESIKGFPAVPGGSYDLTNFCWNGATLDYETNYSAKWVSLFTSLHAIGDTQSTDDGGMKTIGDYYGPVIGEFSPPT